MFSSEKNKGHKKENLASTGVKIFTEWLKANTKKPKAALKAKIDTRNKLSNLSNKLSKSSQKEMKDSPILFQKPLSYDESYKKRGHVIQRKAFGSMKPATRDLLEKISVRKTKANPWQDQDTLRYLSNNAKLRERVDIPSNGVFAGTRLHSEKTLDQLKNKKVTLHVLFPGIGGSANNRFNKTFRKDENAIGVTVEDAVALKQRANGSPYYLWHNMKQLSIPKRKEALTTYFSNLVNCIEARTGCRIDKCTLSGHSGGGRLLHYITQCFPGFQIPIHGGRTILAEGISGCDSQYEGNAGFCYSYLGRGMRKEVLNQLDLGDKASLNKLVQIYKKSPNEQIKDQISKKVEQICQQVTLKTILDFLIVNLGAGNKAKLKQIFQTKNPDELISLFEKKSADEALNELTGNGAYLLGKGQKSIRSSVIPYQFIKGMRALQPIIVNRLLKGTLKTIKFPKYFASIEDNGWRHQRRVNNFILAKNGTNGVKGERIIDRYPDSKLRNINNKSKKRHWYAWGKYSREAIDHMSS